MLIKSCNRWLLPRRKVARTTSLTTYNTNDINASAVFSTGGAVAQLGARLDGIEEVVGSNPIGSTNKNRFMPFTLYILRSETH